ncbi:hypothetical protein ACFQJD_03435 [Haloplanus sp. GCM10025708]|uniref:hypothetical protein n=1 Tax=Haloferacaceae TaxID=1644056 RepID=UPI0036159129
MAPRKIVLSLFVVLLATSAVATASPRPVPVCGPCDRPFVSAARGHGVDLEIRHSTAHVRVHGNGSASWTVENRVDEAAAERFRDDAALVDRVAADSLAAREAEAVRASVDERTVTIRYRTPDFARDAPGNVLLVTYFRDDVGRDYDGLGADRLTLVAPEGRVVDRALSGASVEGREMTLTSFDSHGDGPFVTLVPEGGLVTPLTSFVAVAAAVGDVVARNLLLLVAVPLSVYLGVVAAVAWAAGRTGVGERGPEPLASLVVGIGLLLAAHPLYAGALSLLGSSSPALFAAGVGVAVLGAAGHPAVRRRLSLAGVTALVGGAFVVAVGVAAALQATQVADAVAFPPHARIVRHVLPALPVYATLAVGYAAARDDLRRGLAVAGTALALVLAVQFPLFSSGGTLYGLAVVLAVGGAFAAAVVGVPALLLGYAVERT